MTHTIKLKIVQDMIYVMPLTQRSYVQNLVGNLSSLILKMDYNIQLIGILHMKIGGVLRKTLSKLNMPRMVSSKIQGLAELWSTFFVNGETIT